MVELETVDGDIIYVNPDRVQWLRKVVAHPERQNVKFHGPVTQIFYSPTKNDFAYVKGEPESVAGKLWDTYSAGETDGAYKPQV